MPGAHQSDSKRSRVIALAIAVLVVCALIFLLASRCSLGDSASDNPSASAQKSSQSATSTSPSKSASEDSKPAGGSASDHEIDLYFGHGEDNVPFAVVGMLPGDSVTQGYEVVVSYLGDSVLHFGASVRDGYEKLSEVLCVRVESPEGACLYDGLMRDAFDVAVDLPYADQSSEAATGYRITSYLDTSVGNAYQNLQLVADFGWWVTGGKLVPTGDQHRVIVIAICAVALIAATCACVAWRKRRKEEQGND